MTHAQGPLGGPRPLAVRRRSVVILARDGLTGPAGIVPRPLAEVKEEE